MWLLDEDIGCTLESILIFVTGSSAIPPLGFACTPTVAFYTESTMPSANVCSLTLQLPVSHETYNSFREAMLMGILGNDGYGKL